MCEDSFSYLAADAHHGVERGHRLLKDHGDGAAAARAHGGFIENEEIFGSVWFAGKLKAARDGRSRWKQPKQSERRCRFAGAGLADEADGFAVCDVEGDAVNSLLP